VGDILTTIADWVSKVPGDVWNLLPGLGLPGWLAWLPKVFTGGAALAGITRFIPDNWCYQPIVQFFDKLGLAVGLPLRALGIAMSKGGRNLLGRRLWEKIEVNVFEKGINLIFRAVVDGLVLFVQRIRSSWLDGLDADDPGVGNTHRVG